jgi:pyridoxal phosphate enzyme (YggS family)
MTRSQFIQDRLQTIKNNLKNTQLIAVTKYSPIEDVVLAYEANHFDFGENKVQDLKEKALVFTNQNLLKVRWHFIGHLQSNKAKDLLKIPNLYAIHSVDSIKLLQELIKHQSLLQSNKVKIFLQVNTSNEEEKSGFENQEELEAAVMLLMNQSRLEFFGLMTMGTIRTENFEGEARRCFLELKKIKMEIEKKFHLSHLNLSMGMSQDYLVAVESGSDFVRIGSAIFK